MKNGNTVSCIIPAYNEGDRIAHVLDVVVQHPLISEIIVVDDGSRDATTMVVRRFRKVTLISNKINKGKSFSVARGIRKAKNDIILLLDADFTTLTEKDISALINPVLDNKADVSIALMKNPLIMRILGVDFASGQRVLPKQMIPYKKLSDLEGYGLEVFINDIIIQKKLRLAIVKWIDVESTRKSRKSGYFQAFLGYLSMWASMVKQLFRMGNVSAIFSQTYNLRRLRVNV